MSFGKKKLPFVKFLAAFVAVNICFLLCLFY